MTKVVGVKYEDGACESVMITTDGEDRIRFDRVRRGIWKPYRWLNSERQTGWICTNCSGVVFDLAGDTDYCPHCGAVMDRED